MTYILIFILHILVWSNSLWCMERLPEVTMTEAKRTAEAAEEQRVAKRMRTEQILPQPTALVTEQRPDVEMTEAKRKAEAAEPEWAKRARHEPKVEQPSLFEILPPEIKANILLNVTGATIEDAVRNLIHFMSTNKQMLRFLSDPVFSGYLIEKLAHKFTSQDKARAAAALNTPGAVTWFRQNYTREQAQKMIASYSAGLGGDTYKKRDRLMAFLVRAFPHLTTNIMNQPILEYAVQFSKPELLKELIKAGADIQAKNEKGKTAFDEAMTSFKTMQGDSSILIILINAGADLKGALLFAILSDLPNEIIKALLLKGANPNDPENSLIWQKWQPYNEYYRATTWPEALKLENNTPLIALAQKRKKIINDLKLTSQHAQLRKIMAVRETFEKRLKDSNEILDFLLRKNLPWVESIDVNAHNRDKLTALHIAISAGDVYMAQKLLAAGAQPDMRDSRGETPLILAAKNLADTEYNAISQLLSQAGTQWRLTDSWGKSALDYRDEFYRVYNEAKKKFIEAFLLHKKYGKPLPYNGDYYGFHRLFIDGIRKQLYEYFDNLDPSLSEGLFSDDQERLTLLYELMRIDGKTHLWSL